MLGVGNCFQAIVVVLVVYVCATSLFLRQREISLLGLQPRHNDEQERRKPDTSVEYHHVFENTSGASSNETQIEIDRPAAGLRLPDFLLAGAQKAGTSATAFYLIGLNGTRICLANEGNRELKEVHYFDKADNLKKGTAWYANLWSRCKHPAPIRMDATPNYLGFPRRIWNEYRAQNMTDQVKIMFLLREPVSRELSRYHHMGHQNMQLNIVPTWSTVIQRQPGIIHNLTNLQTFEEYMHGYVLANLTPGRSWSLYVEFFQDWLALFLRRNIWIANYAESKEQPDQFLQKLHTFLDLPEETGGLPRSNSKPRRVENPSCSFLKSHLPVFELYNQRLYKLLEEHSVGAPSFETQPFPQFNFSCP